MVTAGGKLGTGYYMKVFGLPYWDTPWGRGREDPAPGVRVAERAADSGS